MGAYLTHLVLVLIALTCINLVLLLRFSRNRGVSKLALDELYAKIKEDIKFSVAPKFIQLSSQVEELVELATEIWRIEQRLAKSADSLPEIQKKGLENSVHKLKAYLDKYDVEIVDYTDKKFNDGLNLDVLSVEKDSTIEVPFVKETVEPSIICKGQVVKKAKIILVTN